jgi:hypothetical protein
VGEAVQCTGGGGGVDVEGEFEHFGTGERGNNEKCIEIWPITERFWDAL